MIARVAGLNIFPVKSMRGIALPAAQFIAQGIAGDRMWMVVDRDGRFVTQRTHPKLATIAAHPSAQGLTLEHDIHGAMSITQPFTTLRAVQVWSDSIRAFDAGDDIAHWLENILGTPVRLVYFDDTNIRLSSRAYAGNSGAHTRFADGFSVLVTNQKSLEALNSRLPREIAMDRFRANLVIDGLDAWDEDHIDTLTFGVGVVLRLVKPCVRCITTTTDQLTGSRLSHEPLATLAHTRMNEKMGGVTFGENAIVVAGGTAKLNDVVQVSYRF